MSLLSVQHQMVASARKKAAASPAQDATPTLGTPSRDSVRRKSSGGSSAKRGASAQKIARKADPDPEVQDREAEKEEEEEEEEEAPTATQLRGTGKGKKPKAALSAESLSFFKMSSRMMNAGKATATHLKSRRVSAGADADSGKKTKGKDKGQKQAEKQEKQGFVMASSWAKPSNAIESAQSGSALYDGKVGSTHSLLKSSQGKAMKSLGKGWFDAAPAELTSQLKADMKVVQMRNYLDPKRFYKNPDKMKNVIGVGTVIEGPDEFISQRMTRKERKQSLVGEILADSKIKDYTKRKYAEIQTEKERNSFKKKKQNKMGQRKGVGSGGRKIRKLY